MIFFTDPYMLQNNVSLCAEDKSLIKTNGNQHKKGKNITEKRHKRMAADLMRATSSAFVPGSFLTEAATSKTGRTKTLDGYSCLSE